MRLTLHLFFTVVFAFVFMTTLYATTYTAIATGVWSASSTWDANGVPDGSGSGDVIIPDAFTVTIDANFIIHNLTIGGGTSGGLKFSKTFVAAIVVNGDIVVNAGATFAVQSNTTGGSGIAHTLDLKGNLTHNGTSFTFRTGTSGTTLSVCNLTLSGTTNSTLTAIGAYSTANCNFNAITINKTGGAKVILGSNIIMSGGSTTGSSACYTILTFVSGIVETGSYLLICQTTTDANVTGYSSASYINGGFGRAMSSSAATSKIFPVGDVNGFRPFTLQSTTSGAATGHYAIVRCIPGNANTGSSVFTGSIDTVSMVRYYQVGYNNLGTGAASMSFCRFSPSYGLDDGVYAENTNLRVAYSTDSRGTWNGIGPLAHTTTLASPPTKISSDSLLTALTLNAGVGSIYVSLADAVGGENPLPVELSSFTSNVDGRDISLNWITKTEKNSNKFDIERFSNLTWVSVGTVKASVLSNSPKQYSFTDKNLQAGTYQYRLKMIDNDGSFNYSKIVETEVALPKAFDLSQNYPNPFNPSTKINYSLPSNSNVTLEVYSISGERIAQLVNENQVAGFYSVSFASSSLRKSISSGVYFYRITAVDNNTGNQFSSIKKMIILK